MPVVFLISYRGTPGEPVGAQGGMAKITEDILQTLRIPLLHCTSENDLEKISTFSKHAKVIESPDIEIEQLKSAFIEVLKRAEIFSTHNIQSETLSVRERMSSILSGLKLNDNILFEELFNVKEGRLGVIVTFLAILELVKESLIDITQNESMSNIYIGLK